MAYCYGGFVVCRFGTSYRRSLRLVPLNAVHAVIMVVTAVTIAIHSATWPSPNHAKNKTPATQKHAFLA